MKIQCIQDLPGLDTMKKALTVFLLMAAAVLAVAQTRDDIRIYIPPVLASPDQAAFFKESFEMETQGAGYALTDSAADADYTLKLEVKPNMILYDDGTTEQAPPDEKQFLLHINLIRNEDDVEIVAFSFLFDKAEEMHDYDLYLLYEAMANVPLTKLASGDFVDDRWRNKWVYIRTSFDFPITYYNLQPTGLPGGQPALFPLDLSKLGEHDPEFEKIQPLKIDPKPAATIGLELQYLYFMSTELNFQLRFGDPMSNTFIPSIQIQQKFPIKPSTHFMIEPYGHISFPMATSENVKLPMLYAGGGFQFGVKGGSMGAFFVDANITFALGDVIEKNTNIKYDNPANLHYFNMIIGLGIGYKIGFVDRPNKK